VRKVYPNTQNAEQAARESRSAQGKADASKPGDVTPVSNAKQQPSSESAAKAPSPAAQPAQPPQQNAQTQSPQPTRPASAAQSTPPSAQAASAPSTPPSASSAAASQASAPAKPVAAQPTPQSNTGVVALDTQQQTSIGHAIAQRGIKPLTNVNFSIAVGTKVPAPVQLRALPADVVTFLPQYRGYSYVVVEEQIVVVNPGSHEIVAIVPFASSAPPTQTVETSTIKTRERSKPKPGAVAQKPMISRSVNLNTEERGAPRRHATEPRATLRTVTKREIREGERAPRIEVERAPRAVTVEESAAPVYREPPRRRGFFGFFRNDDDDVED